MSPTGATALHYIIAMDAIARLSSASRQKAQEDLMKVTEVLRTAVGKLSGKGQNRVNAQVEAATDTLCWRAWNPPGAGPRALAPYDLWMSAVRELQKLPDDP